MEVQYPVNDARPVIIIGMHRSGTSLVANWLAKCGLNIGENLLGAAIGNVDGHFEDIDFNDIHKEILKKNGLPDSGLITSTAINVGTPDLEKLQELIKAKTSKSKIWGWKDPRTCLFLDIYRKLLPNALHLIIVRDYQSVVVSLLNRAFSNEFESFRLSKNFLSRTFWRLFKRRREFKRFCSKHAALFLQAWIYYNQSILENLREHISNNCLVIDYKLLKTNDFELISYLKKNCQLSLTYFEFSMIYKEELISDSFNIERYMTDKSLIQRAKELQGLLYAYLWTGS